MSKYIVEYDCTVEDFGTYTLKEKATNFEDAKRIVQDLKANDVYSNFNIVNLEEGR